MRAPFLTAALAAIALLLAAGAPGAAAQSPPPAAELTSLVQRTKALPRIAGGASQRNRLRGMASAARRSAKTGHECSALKLLARYRRIVPLVEFAKSSRAAERRLAELATDSVAISEALLALDSTRRCGGGVPPRTLAEARTTVIESGTSGMKLRVELPALRFVPRTGLGQAWTQLVLPMSDVTAPGEPGIPVVGATFGVPSGAKLRVEATSAESYVIDSVDVFPAQPQAVDQVTPPPNFEAPPFTEPPVVIAPQGAYDDDRAVPPRLAKGAVLGTMRDVRIGNLEVPSAQWNPGSGRLRVLRSVDVTVRFQGGSKRFDPEVGSPWEAPQRSLVSGLLNAELVRGEPTGAVRACGEEMLVITNPATLPAANQLAEARRAAGLRTSVFETGGAVGTTPAQIRRFIRGRVTATGCVHPSYVTILGDDDLVPTFRFGPGRVPSDLPYAMRDDADELPDLAVGRIVGDDNAAVTSAVTKIVKYETSPPSGPMLDRAAIAAQFQDDDADGTENRTFIQFAETVRAGLVERGVAVDRIYHDDFSTAPPRKFNDGTDLPPELLKPGFEWRGGGTEVSAAWNEGRFLMVHRDHGWSDGWGQPAFDTNGVQTLTNGDLLPVLMSINCSSAAYDKDETSFVGEALVKPDGGAVAAFGDTRDSPTRHNTQIGLGFVDALLPNALDGEGPSSRQRLGNALVHGKLRLAGRWPPSGPRNPEGDELTRDELHMWHLFGDPSMQMWGGGPAPVVLDPDDFTATLVRDTQPYAVRVTLPEGLEGQTVSLLRDGQVVGKAFARGGVATVPAAFGDANAEARDLRIALEPDGSPPVGVPVDG